MTEIDKNAENELFCVKVTPVSAKWADEDLKHRDFLGALMNLGLERRCIGDILVGPDCAYVYCSVGMDRFIVDNLKSVKHTFVNCEVVSPDECQLVPEFEETRVNVASERVDVVVAGVYNLSRTVAARLITSEYIKINDVVAKNSGVKLKEGDEVSVRNHGKFIYDGIDGLSRKSRLYVKIRKYL